MKKLSVCHHLFSIDHSIIVTLHFTSLPRFIESPKIFMLYIYPPTFQPLSMLPHCYPFFRLCGELKVITERALSTPGDTLQLMEHKSYMEDVMENQLSTLEKRVWRLHQQLQVGVCAIYSLYLADIIPTRKALHSEPFFSALIVQT